MSRKLKFAVILVIALCVIITTVAINNNNDMEQAIAIMRIATGRHDDGALYSYRILIEDVYEQSRPETRKEAARALHIAMRCFEADYTKSVDFANKLIEINKLTGVEYGDSAVIVQKLSHECEITYEQAIDIILDQMKDWASFIEYVKSSN